MPKTHRPRHVLSADQFDPDTMAVIFRYADAVRQNFEHERRHQRLGNTLAGKIMYRLFYAASTRTYESFGFAATHLGMAVLGTQSVEYSSVSKGETLADTIRTITAYRPDVIVLRTTKTGEAKQAAAVSNVPIINAGDGSGEHPTQALLDAYTIRQEMGRLEDLELVMVGDLWNGRTVRSLVILTHLLPGIRYRFVSPPHFEMRPDIKRLLDRSGTPWSEAHDLESAVASADALYWTRVQAERLTPRQKQFLAEHPETHQQFTLTLPIVQTMKPSARVLHPLPRKGEIATEVDSDPRAAYFRQMHNGMIVRMALIEWVLGYLT